jgi:transposase
MHLAGKSHREMAEKLGLSRKSVSDYIYTYKRDGDWPEPEPEPVKQEEGATKKISLYVPAFQRRAFTHEDMRDAKAMRACLAYLERENK